MYNYDTVYEFTTQQYAMLYPSISDESLSFF